MNTDNTNDPATLSNKIAQLMPECDERRMWRTMQAQGLELLAKADDATLIRAGQKANEYEDLLPACVTGHPGVLVTPIPTDGFRDVCLRLSKLDSATRNKILSACAAEFRRP